MSMRIYGCGTVGHSRCSCGVAKVLRCFLGITPVDVVSVLTDFTLLRWRWAGGRNWDFVLQRINKIFFLIVIFIGLGGSR